MKKIVIDSNFLIEICRFRISLFEIIGLVTEPVQFFTVDLVIDELKKISNSQTNDSKYAKVALGLTKDYSIKILSSTKPNTDNAIIALADKDTIVATNDIELRKRLKNKGIKSIYLRAKKHLVIG